MYLLVFVITYYYLCIVGLGQESKTSSNPIRNYLFLLFLFYTNIFIMATINLTLALKEVTNNPFTKWTHDIDQEKSVLEVTGKLHEYGRRISSYAECDSGEVTLKATLNGQDITPLFAILFEIFDEDIQYEIWQKLEEEREMQALEEAPEATEYSYTDFDNPFGVSRRDFIR